MDIKYTDKFVLHVLLEKGVLRSFALISSFTGSYYLNVEVSIS